MLVYPYHITYRSLPIEKSVYLLLVFMYSKFDWLLVGCSTSSYKYVKQIHVKKKSSTIYIVIHKNEGGVRQHRATTYGSLWISMECLLRYENKAFCSGYNVPTRNIHKMSWTCKECGTLKTRSPLMVSYNTFCIITSKVPTEIYPHAPSCELQSKSGG